MYKKNYPQKKKKLSKTGEMKTLFLPEMGDTISSKENLALVTINVIADPFHPCV